MVIFSTKQSVTVCQIFVPRVEGTIDNCWHYKPDANECAQCNYGHRLIGAACNDSNICPAGTELKSDECVECGLGKYSKQGKACQVFPDGYTSKDRVNIVCNAGYSREDLTKPCVPCPLNFTSPINGTCSLCPDLRTSDDGINCVCNSSLRREIVESKCQCVSSTFWSKEFKSCVCQVGAEWNEASSNCSKCNVDHVSDAGLSPCTKCPDNEHTYG